METGSDTTKILEKGPEYFRKQMELESETKGGMSAVERLAASKLKYVKSQQVAHTTQESLISLGSASVSSTESSKRSSNRGEKLVTVSHPKEATIGACSPGQIRRCSSKKRPDSLLLYRQKCDLLKGAAGRKHYAARRRLVNKNVPLVKVGDEECENEDTTPEETAKECSPHGAASQSEGKKNGSAERVTESRGPRSKVTLGLLAVPEFERRAGKGVSRSHSDISSRYSKNFADFDAFFMYCGLEGEVIESLGRENFSARSDEISLNIRSISVSTDDGFSRSSGDSDGLQEEKLHGNLHQGTSVIERNARIIKWLYSCRNTLESGKKLRDLD